MRFWTFDPNTCRFERASKQAALHAADVAVVNDDTDVQGFCRSKGLRLKSACVARLFKRPVSRTGWQRTRLCLVGSTALF